MRFAVYVFVNSSLGMSKGKIAAQCMHAMRYACGDLHNRSSYIRQSWELWENNGGKTITLKAKDDLELEELLEDYQGIIVRDAGCTQIAPGSKTVCILFPIEERKDGFKNSKGVRYSLL